MAGRKLAVTTVVPVPHGVDSNGEGFKVFGPGDDVPDWAAKQIGDHCWATDGDAETGDEAPPRSGRGSGRDAWAEFAAARGVDVGDDDNRDDIVGKLEAAGVIDREQ